MYKKALDIHDAFAGNLALENQILWDAYTPRQFPLFKEKLKILFRGSGNQGSKENKTLEKLRDTIYKSTIAQTKYTNNNLLSTYILVTVAKGTSYVQARDATEFSVHLIVRTRKCMKNGDSSKCCMVFIDEHGRVYQNWKSFIEDNLLPKGIALAPSNGIYTFQEGKLSMDSWETPANRVGSKVIATTDVAACIGGFAAAGVSLAALAVPVAAPVVTAAGAMYIGTGIYSAVRSGWELKRRRDHEQSIALTDRAARGCWIGVTSGALAVSSSVASRSLTQIALAGKEVSLIHETVVNGMNISTMLLSGTGVANGILDILLKYSDDEKITAGDWLQVSASLLIFTHSIYNFRLASNIVKRAPDSRANAYRTELRSRLREMFNKMISGTIHTEEASTGQMDLIRLINEVPDNQNYTTSITDIENLLSSCQHIFRLVEPLILNKDNFESCVLYIKNKTGPEITVYLMKKAKELVDKFRRKIEAFIRTTLYYETVLWDLYQKCEELLVTLTLENLEQKMSTIFTQVLVYYEKMSCQNHAAEIIECKICNGCYQICPIY